MKKALAVIPFLACAFFGYFFLFGLPEVFKRFLAFFEAGLTYKTSAEFLIAFVINIVLGLFALFFFRLGKKLFKS